MADRMTGARDDNGRMAEEGTVDHEAFGDAERLAAVAWSGEKGGEKYGKWRHALGILCLLTTVFLWTASNFLASVRLCPSQI